MTTEKHIYSVKWRKIKQRLFYVPSRGIYIYSNIVIHVEIDKINEYIDIYYTTHMMHKFSHNQIELK